MAMKGYVAAAVVVAQGLVTMIVALDVLNARGRVLGSRHLVVLDSGIGDIASCTVCQQRRRKRISS